MRALFLIALVVGLPGLAAAEGSAEFCPGQAPAFPWMPLLPDIVCLRESEQADVRCREAHVLGIGTTTLTARSAGTGATAMGYTRCADGARDQAILADADAGGATVDLTWFSSTYGSPPTRASRIDLDIAAPGATLETEWSGSERTGAPKTCEMRMTAAIPTRTIRHEDRACAARPPDSPPVAWGTVMQGEPVYLP